MASFKLFNYYMIIANALTPLVFCAGLSASGIGPAAVRGGSCFSSHICANWPDTALDSLRQGQGGMLVDKSVFF